MQNNAGSAVRAKMDPPKLHAGSDVQAWDQFTSRWEIFKSTMNITTGSSMWLFNCLDDELGDTIYSRTIGGPPNPPPHNPPAGSQPLLALKIILTSTTQSMTHTSSTPQRPQL